MKKIIFLLVMLVPLFALLIFSTKRVNIQNIKKVCNENMCFEVEIAETNMQRARGLMGRESLPENAGMLFVFEKEDFHSFWMKNTLIPLDMIWLNADNKIVHIEKNVQPCKTEVCPSYRPLQKAKYVLEINGGLCDKLGIKTGDTVVRRL